MTGNEADNYERRAPGTAGMEDGVRYQFYATKDGHVLFMASEQRVLAELLRRRRPHRSVRTLAGFEVRRPRARQHRAARASCATSSRRARRTSGSSSASSTTRRSRRRTHRRRCSTIRSSRTGSRCIPPREVGADMLPTPLKFIDEELPTPTKAPTVGEHTEAVLRERARLERRARSRRHARPARSGRRARNVDG